MKKILGLDLGTNSIGWALIEKGNENKDGKILAMGSRIIPMDDNLEFEQGQPVTRNATRRIARGSRRGNHRYKNRRNKLVYILDKLGLLPSYLQYGFESKDDTGEKHKIENKFPLPKKLQSLYLMPIKKGIKHLTAKQNFELRIKALKEDEPIKNEELGKILFKYNQKRGYSGGGNDDNISQKKKVSGDEYSVEFRTLKIKKIEPKYKVEEINTGIKKGRGNKKESKQLYRVQLEKIGTSEKIIGDTLNEYKVGSIVNVYLNKITRDHYYNRILNENQQRIYEEETSVYEKINVKVIDFSKAPERKKVGKKYLSIYKVVLDESEISDDDKLHLDDNPREIALSDIDKADFETGKEVEIECRITKDSEGNLKKVEYAKPNKTNWRKKMESIEKEISKNRKENNKYFLSHYFLNKFNTDESGKWFRVKENIILRKRYKEEFDAIWDNQVKLNKDLKSKVDNVALLNEIVKYLFPGELKSQEQLRDKALKGGLKHLIKEMIIFYQRPLKDQSQNIGICQYEKNKTVIPVSHPLYQEFRTWDQINKIYVMVKQLEESKKKYSKKFIPDDIKFNLYKTLHSQKEVTFNKLEEILSKAKDENGNYILLPNFRENTEKKSPDDKKNKQKYFYDAFINGLHRAKTIKGNETLFEIQKLLGKDLFEKMFGVDFIPCRSDKFLKFFKLWRLLYDQYGNESDMDDPRVVRIKDFILKEMKIIKLSKTEEEIDFLIKKLAKHKFQRKYGSVSKRAIKNIWPLMQIGQELPNEQKERLESLKKVYEEYKNRLKDYTEEDEKHTGFSKAILKDHYKEYIDLNELIDKGGWMNWAACQLMYGRHTARLEGSVFENPVQIKPLSKEETLRNPVVEQIVNEALQVVKDIWKTKEFRINNKELEIRVELARELKNSASERRAITEMIDKNEKTNKEAINEIMQLPIIDAKGNVRKPQNLWDEGRNECSAAESGPLQRIPTKNEITKYKLWKEQSFVCPYTGSVIPMCKLFSQDGAATYNKEHIIPRQRFFDNSNGNLVIADRMANALKDNLTAVEFIKAYGGTPLNNQRTILNWEEYESHVKKNFKGKKLKYLLLEKIPEGFVERQIKDTQYIARKVKEKLMQVVGEKNVVTTTGSITDYLRESWGLNELFKEMTQDRFKRMALVAGENPENWARKQKKKFDGGEKQFFVIKPEVWSKRLDHRHHAIDALIVAATDQGMITQLNTLHQKVQDIITEKKEFILNELRLDKDQNPSEEELMDLYSKLNEEKRKRIFDNLESLNKFDLPWVTFKTDAENHLRNIVVSHKRKQKILIQKQKVKDKATGHEKEEWQLKIRGALHQETVYGKHELSIPEEKTISIKSAFALPEYIVDTNIRQQVIERLEANNWDIDECVDSLKNEKIRISEEVTDKKGKIKIKEKSVNKVLICFTEKDVYRLPIEKFGEKKNVSSFIDKIASENLKSELNNHLHNFCFTEKLEDKENPIDDKNLSENLSNLLKERITEERLEKFYESLNNSDERKKIKGWVNGKLAFTGDGLKTLNNNRKHPINAVKVLYSKTTNADALKHINRGYVKTASNYCMLVLKKGYETKFAPVSFFDAVQWVTKQFNIDKNKNYPFPEFYDKKIEYINNIVTDYYKKENPDCTNCELQFIIQNDDLVEFIHPETHVKSIYRVVKMTGEKCYFTPHNYSRHIVYKQPIEGEEVKVKKYKIVEEYDSEKNCSQFLFDEDKINALKRLQKNKEAKKLGNEVEKLEKFEGIRIQEHCTPYKVNRLGKPIVAPPKNQKHQKSSNDNNLVKEPNKPYSGSKKITTSDSFEDVENSQMKYWSELTPEQRFADFFELMKRFYNFVKPDWSNQKIIIDT